MTVPVKIKKLREDAIIPTKGSEESAGYDIYAAIDNAHQVTPHHTGSIGTGLAIEVPNDYWIGLFARSGLATNKGLRPANCVGVIDPDYRGEIIMPVHNDSEEAHVFWSGDRIGQLIILPKYDWEIEEVSELEDTERQDGGFGSTGIN